MFGLFGKKSGFDSEMEALDKTAQSIGPKLVEAMNSFNISKQVQLTQQMIELNEKRILCCKQYGRLEEISRWEELNEKARKLLG